MDDQEEQGMDTTYVGIMLVVFLVIAGLAINIGYMYVSEDDLQNAAEVAALPEPRQSGSRCSIPP